ncbi:MAG: gamma carbonic anhydrase family protein [Myxococcales bacterium]|nr:gamma carbonic anhydrase family protein [Myxococcales bacterium]
MNGGIGPEADQKIDPSVWIAPSAQLYGAISVARDASIWHNAVLRAECQRIEIGRMSNLQDFAMAHIAYDNPTQIGEFCSITHRATVHGCTVGDYCLVGIGAVLMDHVVIGEGSIVAGGAFVTEGSVFPPHSIIAGIPAKQIGERDCSRANRLNAWMYYRNVEFTRRGDYGAWTGTEYEAWKAAKLAEIEADRDL